MFLKPFFLAFFLTLQICNKQSNNTMNINSNIGAIQNLNKINNMLPYDLTKPSTIFNLDASLHEISGLTATDKDGQLACIQDESGQLFYLDIQTGKSTPSVIFQNSGDFESIEFVGETLWASTSKGKLFKIWNLDKTPFDVQVFKIESLRTANIEGLGYDKLNHRLLLASKADKADGTLLRSIWAFDLKNETPSVQKAFDIQLVDFQDFLKDKTEPQYAKFRRDYIQSPITTGFEFGPSGIAVHPLTGHIYIVSSVNKVLVVLSPEGKILEMAKLDKTLFQQPEGLCFDSKGTLYISNEAKDKPTASLLVFKMQ